jgi:hypothetical protein
LSPPFFGPIPAFPRKPLVNAIVRQVSDHLETPPLLPNKCIDRPTQSVAEALQDPVLPDRIYLAFHASHHRSSGGRTLNSNAARLPPRESELGSGRVIGGLFVHSTDSVIATADFFITLQAAPLIAENYFV